MTKRTEFVERFKRETGKDIESFKGQLGPQFAAALNGGSGELRALFRAAVEEASGTDTDKAAEAASGLAGLFGNM